GIYGPNASGKSNVLEALAWLSTAVGNSLRDWADEVPRDPFRFIPGPSEPSVYDIQMIASGVRYAYHVEVDDSEVLYESLYSYPERRRRILFERDGPDVDFRRGLGSALAGGTRMLLTPTTLALSAILRLNHPDVEPFARELAGLRTLNVGLTRTWRRGVRRVPVSSRQMTERIFMAGNPLSQELPADDDDDHAIERNLALELLRFADLGIDDVRVVNDDNDREVWLSHRAGSEELLFALSDESAGTRTWFNLIGPVLMAFRYGHVLLVDEIDARLHPRLSARLIELFQDPVTNPRNAQMIFTTHDTSLLNHLNRDEVWLTEKGLDGATTLTALAEFGGDKVRRSLNLERAYLQGRFGAVPELDQVRLREVLGMLPEAY
ncbi:MAG TPA: ATP-binding protein, partial [Streptosporangiaceae bacterium]|nr:ATP-binding protein [Streptosporangiaceae bacterium]